MNKKIKTTHNSLGNQDTRFLHFLKLQTNTEMPTKIRDVRLDELKGLCIYFVVVIHFMYSFFTPTVKPFSFEIINYITGFAVPLFLVSGGFFFAKKFFKKNTFVDLDYLTTSFKSLFRRVIVPYYIFIIVLSCYNFLCSKPIFWPHFLFIDSNSHGLYFLIIYVYSFTFCLFFVYFLQNYCNKKTMVVMIPALSFVFFPIVSMNIDVDKVVFRNLPLISFFAVGIPLYFVQVFLQKHTKNHPHKIAAGLFLLILVLTFTLCILRKVFGTFPVFVSSPPSVWMLIYCSLLFLMSITLLSIPAISKISSKLLLVRFGYNSLFIFLLHPYFINVFAPVLGITTTYLGLSTNNNFFLIPVLVASYFTLVLCQYTFNLLPPTVRNIFS